MGFFLLAGSMEEDLAMDIIMTDVLAADPVERQ